MIIVQFDTDQLMKLIETSVQKAIADGSTSSTVSEPDFLSLIEACKFLNLAPQTIYGFTSSRAIPFFKKGKKLYFKRTDLQKWIDQGRRLSKDELNLALANGQMDRILKPVPKSDTLKFGK